MNEIKMFPKILTLLSVPSSFIMVMIPAKLVLGELLFISCYVLLVTWLPTWRWIFVLDSAYNSGKWRLQEYLCLPLDIWPVGLYFPLKLFWMMVCKYSYNLMWIFQWEYFLRAETPFKSECLKLCDPTGHCYHCLHSVYVKHINKYLAPPQF